MSDASPALDEAFDRMAATDFELPNGFVNHGPMACEALAALDCDDRIDGWARWFTQMVGEGPRPAEPRRVAVSDWREALGDYRLLPEWVGYFQRAITDDGWAPVVGLWVPRLVPGMASALFHGAIRTAHAVRAVHAVDTSARRGEVARALGYWAARFQPGRPPSNVATVPDASRAVVQAAGRGARHYVANPNIVFCTASRGLWRWSCSSPTCRPRRVSPPWPSYGPSMQRSTPMPVPSPRWGTGTGGTSVGSMRRPSAATRTR